MLLEGTNDHVVTLNYQLASHFLTPELKRVLETGLTHKQNPVLLQTN